MRRASRWEGLLLVALSLSGLASAAVGAERAAHDPLRTALLERAGLAVVWQSTLPVKKTEDLATMLLLDDRLYVRSDRNYVWSLDRADGEVVFSRAIAPAGFPILGWSSYADDLICVIDNQLVELDKYTGLERRVTDLELSIVAPPVRNSQFFYISAADRRVHAFRAEDLVRIFRVTAKNDSLVTTVVAGEQMVVFGTDEGNLVAVTSNGPRQLWEFKAVQSLSGPLIQDGDSFFFADKDTHVYRVDMVAARAADLTWRHQTEAVLDRPPRVTVDVVYQYALGRGLTAIDKLSGRTLWSLPEGVDLLAQAAGKAYVITKFKTLTVMDNATGERRYWVNFAPVAHHATNTGGAEIYIADAQGHIACLAPSQ